jgi:hypothetical protein
MRSFSLLPWAAGVALAVVAAAPARAEPAPPDRAAANALFDEGRALMAAGEYADACQRYADSLSLTRRLGVLLNLADCQERRGKTATAWTLFGEAAAMARESADERAGYAAERATALAPRLVHVTIRLDHAPAGVEVRWNGIVVPATSFGVARPVDPGTHRLAVSAPGHSPRELDVVALTEGEDVDIRVPGLEPLATERRAPPLDIAPTASRTARPVRRIAIWATAGVGLAGVVAGGTLGLTARHLWQEAEPHCTSDGTCSDGAYSDVVRARRLGDASTAAFVVGGAALATALILHVTAPDVAPAERLRVAPALTSSGAVLALDGRF